MSLKDLNDDEILEHLKKNTILRNNQLSVLIKLLNSIDDSSTLAIDGAWGSGKTVFVKQLQMLANDTIEDYGHNTLDDDEIIKLRENQEVLYFNAWENDYLGDALGAILLKLIANSDEGLNEAAMKRALSMINPGAAIKKATFDLFDPEGKPRKDRLIKDIQSLLDRHDAVNEFLDEIKERKDKRRIIFIIDELDRCKPSFAIDLLEVIKHYFVRGDVTFILATNITELSHTVQKYYGYKFDGHSYLNKFLDFTVGLQKVDIANYARDVLGWVPNSYVVHEVAHDAIDYFKLQMREINSYHSALRMIDRFLSRDRNWREEQYPIQFIFVPLGPVLKIKNNEDYTDFIEGRGEALLRKFLPHTGSGMRYAEKWVKDRTNLDDTQVKSKAIDIMVEQYHELFIPEGRRGVREDLQDFNDAISLISSYTTIPSEGEK